MPGADFDSVGRPIEFPFDTLEDFLLTLADNRTLEIQAIAFRWGATASVGNRIIQVTVQGFNGNRLFRRLSQRTQVANETINYVWAPGMPDETDIQAGPDVLLQPMPLLTITGPDAEVEIADSAAIDASDDLVGSICARVYKSD